MKAIQLLQRKKQSMKLDIFNFKNPIFSLLDRTKI